MPSLHSPFAPFPCGMGIGYDKAMQTARQKLFVKVEEVLSGGFRVRQNGTKVIHRKDNNILQHIRICENITHA